ncbi:MAG: hypothetical protein ACRC7P_02985 [Enterovibrio sp.]
MHIPVKLPPVSVRYIENADLYLFFVSTTQYNFAGQSEETIE